MNRDEPDTNKDEDEDEYTGEGDTSKTETEDEGDGVESEVKGLEDEAGEVEVGKVKAGKMEAGENKVNEVEAGENEVGESEVGKDGYWGGSEHRQRIKYGQGAEGYDERDEIGDRPSNSVIARAESREQRAWTET